jgi:nitroimidazol reductase NimA-like FMN-containing flavoprotein (pyridoxamine 5'-phosphate oxidase superfamily)
MQRRTIAPHHRSPAEADQRWRGEDTVAYRSVMVFGTIREIADAAGRRRFLPAMLF